MIQNGLKLYKMIQIGHFLPMKNGSSLPKCLSLIPFWLCCFLVCHDGSDVGKRPRYKLTVWVGVRIWQLPSQLAVWHMLNSYRIEQAYHNLNCTCVQVAKPYLSAGARLKVFLVCHFTSLFSRFLPGTLPPPPATYLWLMGSEYL